MASKKTQIDFHRAVKAEIYDIALKRGRAQGFAEGFAQGFAEGLAQVRAAKNMIATGYDTSEIHKATGFSESEIEDLRNA